MSDVSYDTFSNQLNESETPDNGTMASESEDERFLNSQHSASSRKRKRGLDEPPAMSMEDQQHLMWSDELLDYFMLQNSNEPPQGPPEPPAGIDVNRSVDDKGHTPMHWAAAMGDTVLVKDLLRRGARIDTLANNGETPLMRAVMFTNNFQQQTMAELISILHPTIAQKDWFGSTVAHQIAMLTCSKSKYQCARYYLEVILEKLCEIYPPQEVSQLLNETDHNGDSAILLAARHGARRCIRILMSYGAMVDLPNHRGETADELIKQLNARRRERNLVGSSSPAPPPDGVPFDAHPSSATGPKPLPQYHSEAAALLTSQLPSLINSRAEALAAALDADLGEREQEALEATRLLEQRRQEVDSLRIQSRALAAQDHDEADDERQRQELKRLRAECEVAVEAEQRRELKRRISLEEKRTTKHNADGPDEMHMTRLQLARALAEEQSARASLVDAFVAAQSLAGSAFSDSTEVHGGGNTNGLPDGMTRVEAYKRLITSALGVRTEDVETLLGELLAELEAAKAGDDGLGAPLSDLTDAGHGLESGMEKDVHTNGAGAIGLGVDHGMDMHTIERLRAA